MQPPIPSPARASTTPPTRRGTSASSTAGARTGGIITLVISAVVALLRPLVLLYRNRGNAPLDEDDDGQDYDFDDLTGR